METDPYITALGTIMFAGLGIYIIASRKKMRRRAVRNYLKSPKFLRPLYFPGYLSSKRLYYANAIICGSVSILVAGVLACLLLRRLF